MGLLLLLLIFSELFLKGTSRTHGGDIEALKQLIKVVDPSTVRPGTCLSSWDFRFDPCDSVFTDHFTCGFRCDRVISKLSRVTELTLDRASYSAFFSSSFTLNLPYLQTLDLSENSFTGSIPNSFSNLTQLRRLALSANSFFGEIPTSIRALSNLEELFLDNNRLQGSIPSGFEGLKSLKRLELQGNKLSGKFPDLGSLQNLLYLDASNNDISGRLPENLPKSLLSLSLRNNDVEGNLPDIFKFMPFLQVLDLSHNRLSGPLISALFDHSSLQQLTLSYNNFTSLLEPRDNRGAKSELIAVDLSNNGFGGMLPAFITIMPKLSSLSFENNKFTGVIPTEYARRAVVPAEGRTVFARLLLGGNYLLGPIPEPLMGLKPGSVNVSLVDNCLFRCPSNLFFCHGGLQKSHKTCKGFGRVIPRGLGGVAVNCLWVSISSSRLKEEGSDLNSSCQLDW